MVVEGIRGGRGRRGRGWVGVELWWVWGWGIGGELEGRIEGTRDGEGRGKKEFSLVERTRRETTKERERDAKGHSRVVDGGQTPSSSPSSFDRHNLIHSPLGSTIRSSLEGGPYLQGRRTWSVQVLRCERRGRRASKAEGEEGEGCCLEVGEGSCEGGDDGETRWER